jgi:hypothetical protein
MFRSLYLRTGCYIQSGAACYNQSHDSREWRFGHYPSQREDRPGDAVSRVATTQKSAGMEQTLLARFEL